MSTKRLITASIFSLISASTALAADVMIPHQPAPSTSSTIVAPTFSWTGLYLGVQAGGFSSKSDMALVDQEKNLPLDKEFSPKLSGFVGGFYAGSNIDLGDNFIFGVDTDLMISGKKHTKTITIGAADNTTVENAVVRSRRSAPQTLPTSQSVTSTGTQTQKTTSEAPAGAGATTEGTPAAGSAPGKSPTQKADQAPAKPASSGQQPQAGAGQPNQPVATGNSGKTNSTSPSKTLSASQAGTGAQTQKTASGVSAGAGTTTGGTPAAGSASEKSAVTQSSSAPAKPVSAAQPSQVGAAQSNQAAAERTVPSRPLVLARSGSSRSETNTSNGISGAQHGGYHSPSHGSGNANPHGANSHASRSHGGQNMAGYGAQSTQAVDKNNSSVYGIEQMKKLASELGLDQEDEVETLNHTFKQNWGGATRVRIGFAADRFMPYLAGGIAYGQFQDTVSISVKDEDGRVVSSKNLADETKTMIGYTLGGGVDFSLLDNVIVRAEYRYSDFGKKKFAKEKLEVNYKTNDFRVGVAYKF
ncbi:porin [Bartonella sp. TS82HLJMH]|uniref:outer membrane protein n=1 Tax=Bartonella sp. TS82HLJMH TaxID=3243577 RepID=UPI0035CEF3A2